MPIVNDRKRANCFCFQRLGFVRSDAECGAAMRLAALVRSRFLFALCTVLVGLSTVARGQGEAGAVTATVPSTIPSKGALTEQALAVRPIEPTLFAVGTGPKTSSNEPEVFLAAIDATHGPDQIRTILNRRQVLGAQAWTQMPSVDGRILGITRHGTAVVAWVGDGRWMWIDDAMQPGPRLPNGARLITMGGNNTELWALAEGALSPPSTTTRASISSVIPPEDAAKTPATLPATMEATAESARLARPVLQLYQFTGGRFVPFAAVGSGAIDVAGDLTSNRVSLAVHGLDLVVAWIDDGGIQQGLRMTRGAAGGGPGAWITLPPHARPAGVRRVHLISAGSRLALWLDGDGNGAVCDPFSSQDGMELTLDGMPASPQWTDLAIAGDQLRLYFARGAAGGPIVEQRYALDGTRGLQTEVSANIGGAGAAPRIPIIYVVLLTVITLLVLNAIRRQRAAFNAMLLPSGVVIPRVWRRIGSALVDGAPLVVLLWIARNRMDYATGMMDAIDPVLQKSLYICSALYLAPTFVLEMLTARSIGKLLFGLRVVDRSGAAATPRGLVVRNLMRVIHISPSTLMLDAILTCYSPMHQRLGDLFGGTIVVVNARAQTELIGPADEAQNDKDEITGDPAA